MAVEAGGMDGWREVWMNGWVDRIERQMRGKEWTIRDW